jgi:uncharacterized C2H2 Zn-finger protein
MVEEEQDENQDLAEEPIRFSLSVSLDRDGFFRRACPSCGLEFKTESAPADFAWALDLQLRRVSDDIGVAPASVVEEPLKETLRCPFCGHVAESSEMHTEETVSFLRQTALREYALPKLHKMLAGFAESFGRGGRGGGGGFLSISVSFKHEPSPLPPRPIYGPDAADMMIVRFMCCSRSIKVAEGWTDIGSCTYCGTRVSIV